MVCEQAGAVGGEGVVEARVGVELVGGGEEFLE